MPLVDREEQCHDRPRAVIGLCPPHPHPRRPALFVERAPHWFRSMDNDNAVLEEVFLDDTSEGITGAEELFLDSESFLSEEDDNAEEDLNS